MALAQKSRLGPYEIIAPLGAGGMGEVYRARDTRLERDVAIKVLPAHMTQSFEFRQRFEREAKSISQLAHPHICTLHDVGQQDGISYLVMELLEGGSLAYRLVKGPLPLDEVLRHGAEIASALDAAHRKGVIHRDLKPGNIVLTKTGAKLLDFGLAKADGILDSDPSAVTVAQPLTSRGMIVGTFQYMSPEQLEGQEADERTDIFALGAVLYEMATGKRAFEGHSRASLIASIMTAQPRPISELQPMTPPALDRLIRKCLAKDPDARWQSAADAADELRWIAEETGRGAATSQPRSRAKWIAMLAGTFLLAAVLFGTQLVKQRPAGEGRKRLHLSLLPSGELTIGSEPADVAISPDGAHITFVGTDGEDQEALWIRPLDSQSARKLPGTEGATLPFWSPDSRFIAFFANGKLIKVSREGGAPHFICDAPDGRGGAWNRTNTIVFAPNSGGPLQRVPANGGTPVDVTRVDASRGENGHRFPCFLQDGEHFLYVTLPKVNIEYPVRIGDIHGSESVELMTAGGSPQYAPPDLLVFRKAGTLSAQGFDAGRLKLVGDPIPIPNTTIGTGTRSGSSGFSISANGMMINHAGQNVPTKLVWFDREGRQGAAVPLPEANYYTPVFSPDGRSLAAIRRTADADDLISVELERAVTTRLTFGGQFNLSPIWSPDGKWIAFSSDKEGARSIYRVPAGGGSAAELLFKLGGNFDEPRAWSPDGRYIVVRTLDVQTSDDLWLIAAAESAGRQPLLRTPFSEDYVALSPDGRHMAYASNESGRYELYVQSFPDPGPRVQVSTGGLATAIWWRKPNEILYLDRNLSSMMAVAIEIGETIKIGATRDLFKLAGGVIEISAAPDGERFLATMIIPGRAQSAMSVVVNWDAEIRNR